MRRLRFFSEISLVWKRQELKHTIEFMMNHTENDVLNLEDLPQFLKKPTPSEKILPLREAMIEMETKLITEALLQTKGNVLRHRSYCKFKTDLAI